MGLHHSPKIVTNGLVLALDAGDRNSYPGSGTTWYDLSGNSNSGTLTNGPTFDSGNGGSIVFDGVNDVVNSTNNPSLQLTQAFTISVFCKLNPTINNGHVVGKDDVSAGGRAISYGYGGGGTHRLLVVKNGSTTIYQTNTIIEDSIIRHIAVTYNSSNTIFYEDGQIAGTYSSVGEIDTVSTPWTIGSSDSNIFDISGKIYNVKIYNRALTSSEVLQNYNALKGRFGLQ